MIKMARMNRTIIIGRVSEDKALESRVINKEKTDGENSIPVLNLLLETRTKGKNGVRDVRIPVAVWGKKMVRQCSQFLKPGDLVLVEGEYRYKAVKDEDGKIVQNYQTVKASNIEFLSKKLKESDTHKLNYSKNEIHLIGNLVHDPRISKDADYHGFVMAVDRLYPTKEVDGIENDKLTDYVTLVVQDKSKIKSNLKKGSVAIVSGELMTRRVLNRDTMPRIVVNVDEIIGG